jgi:LPXTG-motif cell wall-anchored protein
LPSEKTVGATSSSSFDWNDAGIGAGVALGLVLIAGGGVLVTRRKLVSA